ncbi:MAG: hypothetical protein D6791_16500 [Chloroflexi bacterium]|nr:MAG: hypothetical protein D6791_16500 [Chloroflexota bacterium]
MNNRTPSPNGQPLLQKLLHMLALTEERELTCAEVFELMDYYAELEEAGEDVRSLLPKVTHHLRICPECKEEYEALRLLIGLDDTAVERG